MNCVKNTTNCEHKKTNHAGHRFHVPTQSRNQYNQTRSVDAPPPKICDLIKLDSQKAPANTYNMLVWKWRSSKDCYYYEGCDKNQPISKKVDKVMDKFFDTIRTVENYSHADLIKYIENRRDFWCCVFYIPFLIQTHLVTNCYWDNKFKKALMNRWLGINSRIREFEANYLHPISPTLSLKISNKMGYITLTDPAIPILDEQDSPKVENNGITMRNELVLNRPKSLQNFDPSLDMQTPPKASNESLKNHNMTKSPSANNSPNLSRVNSNRQENSYKNNNIIVIEDAMY